MVLRLTLADGRKKPACTSKFVFEAVHVTAGRLLLQADRDPCVDGASSTGRWPRRTAVEPVGGRARTVHDCTGFLCNRKRRQPFGVWPPRRPATPPSVARRRAQTERASATSHAVGSRQCRRYASRPFSCLSSMPTCAFLGQARARRRSPQRPCVRISGHRLPQPSGASKRARVYAGLHCQGP